MGYAQDRYQQQYYETMAHNKEMILRSEDIRRQNQYNENLTKAIRSNQQSSSDHSGDDLLSTVWELITSAPKTSLYIFGGWFTVAGVWGFQPLIFAIGCGCLWWAHHKM